MGIRKNGRSIRERKAGKKFCEEGCSRKMFVLVISVFQSRVNVMKSYLIRMFGVILLREFQITRCSAFLVLILTIPLICMEKAEI